MHFSFLVPVLAGFLASQASAAVGTQAGIHRLSRRSAPRIPVDAIVYPIPKSIPANASQQLAANPVGVSIEFFTFPDYFTKVSSTAQCLQNLRDAAGSWPPLRVGGTTQDRATYDASSNEAVTYTVSNPKNAPASLIYGPSFISLAATYDGDVILGLNRELNNLNNTIAAASQAALVMSNLDAIELGNEPNFYSASSPVAGGSWNAAKDRASQVYWQTRVSSALDKLNIISAGVFFGKSSYSNQALAGVEADAISTVKDFCSHNYPQGGGNFNLPALMSHSSIRKQIAPYASEKNSADALGKSYIFGETNSATQGGGGISPTFGAGLWIVDYVMQSLLLGVKALYFHQGTIGNCQYCWWGTNSIGAPYYGAYFASMAIAGASQIAPLDDGSTNYAGYAIYQGDKVIRVLLYNSDYYDGSESRGHKTFVLTGVTSASVYAQRLTAAAATSRQDQGQVPTVAGQTFQDGTCQIQGSPRTEKVNVSHGVAQFTLGASEALLIQL